MTEYLVVTIKEKSDKYFNKQLRKYTEKGWEVVSMAKPSPFMYKMRVLLRRK